MNNQEKQTMQPSEQSPEREKLPAPVYYVDSDNDETVLVGINVQRTGKVMSWYDTTKERVMQADKIIDSRGDHYVFKRDDKEGGQTYTFVPMNLENYNASVKDRLFNGDDFTDEQSMIDAFMETKDNAW